MIEVELRNIPKQSNISSSLEQFFLDKTCLWKPIQNEKNAFQVFVPEEF